MQSVYQGVAVHQPDTHLLAILINLSNISSIAVIAESIGNCVGIACAALEANVQAPY